MTDTRLTEGRDCRSWAVAGAILGAITGGVLGWLVCDARCALVGAVVLGVAGWLLVITACRGGLFPGIVTGGPGKRPGPGPGEGPGPGDGDGEVPGNGDGPPGDGPGEPEGPTLAAVPPRVLEGVGLQLRGEGWPDCPVHFDVDGRALKRFRIVAGFPVPAGVRPDPTGTFVVVLDTAGWEVGVRGVTATAAVGSDDVRIRIEVVVDPQPSAEEFPTDDVHKAYWRARHFYEQRFGAIGFVPAGTRRVQIDSVRRLRAEALDLPAGEDPQAPRQPDPAVCNWTPLGAGPVVTGTTGWAGRTLSIAIDPTDTDIVYIGTANGGVWKTTDGGATWLPKSDFQMSLAISALAIDPNNHLRVFAGTGEYNNIGVGTYYGNGLLRSTNGGDTWTELATTTFTRDEISRIVFDPTDATGQKMYLSSSIGVYESPDGGGSWTQLRAGSASDLVVYKTGAPATDITLVAAFHGSGLWTAARTGGTWGSWTQLTDPDIPAAAGRIELAQQATQPKTILAIFQGTGDSLNGIVKTTDGGASWSPVTVRLDRSIGGSTDLASAHSHSKSVPAADMTAAPIARTYTTGSAGTPAHTHTFTVSAADFAKVQLGARVNVTTDTVSGHQHSVALQASGQAWYNMHVAIHPTDANIIYFGEVRLWRNTSGGGTFASVPGVHSDNHAFAFDPAAPTTVWAVGDGGVFKSTNGGVDWADRNRGLSTLQYISVSQHPQWDAVLLGGTQDNGTHRYSGTPAWQLSAGGDGGFTAIDHSLPTRMYHQYVFATFYRSDNAGAPGSWTLKNTGVSAGQFYGPFELDPSNSSVCYYGGNELYRSANSADAWSAVTSGVNGDITAIAVHPTNGDLVYVGTTTGKVYRVQKGTDWALANVTLTDLTAAPLPAGFRIGDLAVSGAGTVWVTIASILWGESGDTFSSDHVYRRTATGWESRSTGLAVANPINTIVVDPTNDNRLFCGGDIGVFRTEDAGGSWAPWDQGLPNVPVFELEIHGPRRLVRAATHGRSIWERPIDTASCPTVDLYLRDNVLDSGRVQPSPSGQPHPFDPSTNVYWWQSADVKVDAPDPGFQTTTPVDDYTDFEFALDHETVRRNRTNRFYVQVHNRGVLAATNVQVRAFFADASAGLPNLPPDFWSSGKPFTGTPTATDWTPIGPTKTITRLEPATPGVLEWDWLVPASAAQHSCLLAVATSAEDPIAAAGVFALGSLVPQHKHATLKNLHVEDPVPGGAQPGSGFGLGMANPGEEPVQADIVVDWGSLPEGTRLFVVFELADVGPIFAVDQQDDGVGRSDEPVFEGEFTDRCGARRRYDLDQVAVLRRDGRSHTTLRGIALPAGSQLMLGLNIDLPELERDAQFDVIQVHGEEIVGGSTYRFRASPPDRGTG